MTVHGVNRCDRCGGKAHVQILTAAGDLFLCRNHHYKHADATARFPIVPLQGFKAVARHT